MWVKTLHCLNLKWLMSLCLWSQSQLHQELAVYVLLAKNFIVPWLDISDENLSISDVFENSTTLYDVFEYLLNEYFIVFFTTISFNFWHQLLIFIVCYCGVCGLTVIWNSHSKTPQIRTLWSVRNVCVCVRACVLCASLIVAWVSCSPNQFRLFALFLMYDVPMPYAN